MPPLKVPAKYTMSDNKLVEKVISILHNNWRDGFSVPSGTLYPFQWNWDSGFTAIGNAHLDPNKAVVELETLFTGQWRNGMIPHIIFHSEKETTYFPNFDFWETSVNTGAPQRPKTSGITQPPVHGFVLEHLLTSFSDSGTLTPALEARIAALVPKTINSHRFLYNYRDRDQEGLVFIYHPWESGRDNSPLWDKSMDRIQIEPNSLPKYTRKDITIAHADERPTSEQYDRYVYLLLLGKENEYDGPGIAINSPFLIQDTLFNAILIQSNASLIRLGEKFGIDVSEVKAWQKKSIQAFQSKLWNESLSTFTGYDLVAEEHIAAHEIGAYCALTAKIASKEQARCLADKLLTLHENGYTLCPSYDVNSEKFDSKRYWRGPVWPHMNWLIYHGLLRYGYSDLADIVRMDAIELIRSFGFYEYFESVKEDAKLLNKGYGGDNFSWTAACILDFIKMKTKT